MPVSSGRQQGARYAFEEHAGFMRVLVTHHLHSGDEMEGRAPDAERAFRRYDDCALQSCAPQFAVDLGRDRDVVGRRPSFGLDITQRARTKGPLFFAPELFAECTYAYAFPECECV